MKARLRLPEAMRCIALAAALGLAGCSALQIEVDVYKGPLVNNEEVQRDQLIAMAMSAKTILYTARNRLLDDGAGVWSSLGRCGPEARARTLRLAELEDVCGRHVAAVPLTSAERDSLRQARQFNTILLSYDNLAPPELRKQVAELQTARAAYARARAAVEQDPEVIAKRLTEVLGALLALHAAAEPNSPAVLRTASRSIASVLSPEGLDKAFAGCGGESPGAAAAAKRLRVEVCLIEQPQEARKALAGNDLVRKAAATGSALDPDTALADGSFELTLKDLSARDATGFDAGRVDVGIDDLADEYARTRDAWLRAGKPPPREGAPDVASAAAKDYAREKDAAFARLQHTLSDAASRMQFLATNLFLVGEGQALRGLGIKGTLEAIANTILVHADDLGRQRQFEEAQRAGAERERRAAAVALRPDPEAAVRRVSAVIQQRIAAVERAASAAEGEDAVLTARRAELEKAEKAELEEAKAGAVVRVRDDWGRALHTLLGLQSRGVSLPDSTDLDALRADGRELLAELRKGDGVPAPEALRDALHKGIAARLADRTSQLRKARPSTAQLTAAQQFLDGPLKPMSSLVTAKTRAAAVEAFLAEVGEGIVTNRVALQQSQDKLTQAKAGVSAAQRQLANRTAAISDERLTLAQLSSVKARIDSVRGQVLQDIVRTRAEAAAVPRLMADALKAKALGTSGDESAAFEAARAELERLPLAAALQAPPDGATVRDVQDDLIAQLRYGVIEARRTADPLADSTAAALRDARKQREDSIYVRPASTYLRSALPITALQEASSNKWQNMLLQDALRSPSSVLNRLAGSDSKDDAAKANLDKAHWQNINNVRVSGAGSTNYVIAKDDVGNWYVKAMGSDPVAMANTARRLALFNAGGRFDTNLVRADELRSEIDERRRKGDSNVEQQAELDKLVQGQSGPAVAARGDTLALFQKHYAEQSTAQLVALRNRLQADAPLVALRKRFDATMERAPDPKALDGVLARELVRKRYDEALDAVQREGAAATPGNSIIASLRALNGTREALAAGLAEDKTPLEKPLGALDKANSDAESVRMQLEARTKEEQGAADKFAQESAAFDQSRGASTAERDAAGTRRDDANRQYGQRVTERRLAEKALQDKLALQTAAELGVAAARARVARAQEDVDAVFRKLVADTVAERLRVVAEAETAVKVVGLQQGKAP